MKYLLRRDSNKVLDELTIKRELKDHLVLEGKNGSEYKIAKKPVAYNEKLHDIISTKSPYVAKYVYVEEI